MRRFGLTMMSVLAGLTAAGCARNEPIQTDRTAFNFDSSYQRASFAQPIETTFDRTVKVFRESGYVLDIVDRATGQISGRRGKTADKGGRNEVKLQFFALVMPAANHGSQLALKFTQVARVGIPVISEARAEVILSQPELYAYVFRRVDSASDAVGAAPAAVSTPAAPAEGASNANADLMPADPATPQQR
ncbi:MAG: hypothetical protein KGN98_05450 [Alphaproteobacteria bacterium]|nr:hypothetical protein [Alphaproteobacteria bacterium]